MKTFQIIKTSEASISLFIINNVCYWFKTERKEKLLDFMENDYDEKLGLPTAWLLEWDLKVFLNEALDTGIL